jgi:Initiator Replication protein
VTFSPLFDHIWQESKKRLPKYVAEEPANIWLRSRYSIRLYGWEKKNASEGTKSISLEELRKVLGLEPAKDAAGNVIQEPPLPVWANFRQRALDTAIAEITKKTDSRAFRPSDSKLMAQPMPTPSPTLLPTAPAPDDLPYRG